MDTVGANLHAGRRGGTLCLSWPQAGADVDAGHKALVAGDRTDLTLPESWF